MGQCHSEEKDYGKALDDDSGALSYVGDAAYKCLSTQHAKYWHKLWNVTTGVSIGEVHQTPMKGWGANADPPNGHDDWFPAKMGEILSRTKHWADVTSLAPPDGLFLEAMKKALVTIAQTAAKKDDPIIIRMMFGNIVGMPVDVSAVIESLTENLPDDANIRLWVGAWRKGVSWNHAKIIAVDGFYLHTGGHNMWDQHYLKFNPVHDISMELRGTVAYDGHRFANEQWRFVQKEQTTLIGKFVSSLPDNIPMILPARVTVSEYPEGVADEFPPQFKKSCVPKYDKPKGEMPMISMGRYGAMEKHARVSDDAFVAMFDAAKKSLRFALQDLGPITLPNVPGPVAVPSCEWPVPYMSAIGRALYERDVQVEIAVSNPGSVPGGLKPTEALYGNGWTCAQVASEIIQTILDQYDDVDDATLRKIVKKNLRISYIRQVQGNKWANGGTMGFHAKHFIIDDRAYYIGSQNLYIADLAEWGVLIDNEKQAKKVMQEYWNPMWKASYTPLDCNEDEVIDGLGIDRNGDDPANVDDDTKDLAQQAHRAHHKVPENSAHHGED